MIKKFCHIPRFVCYKDDDKNEDKTFDLIYCFIIALKILDDINDINDDKFFSSLKYLQ